MESPLSDRRPRPIQRRLPQGRNSHRARRHFPRRLDQRLEGRTALEDFPVSPTAAGLPPGATTGVSMAESTKALPRRSSTLPRRACRRARCAGRRNRSSGALEDNFVSSLSADQRAKLRAQLPAAADSVEARGSQPTARLAQTSIESCLARAPLAKPSAIRGWCEVCRHRVRRFG